MTRISERWESKGVRCWSKVVARTDVPEHATSPCTAKGSKMRRERRAQTSGRGSERRTRVNELAGPFQESEGGDGATGRKGGRMLGCLLGRRWEWKWKWKWKWE